MNKTVWKVIGAICFTAALIFFGVTFYKKHKDEIS